MDMQLSRASSLNTIHFGGENTSWTAVQAPTYQHRLSENPRMAVPERQTFIDFIVSVVFSEQQ